MSEESTTSIGFELSTTDATAALGMRVLLDNIVIYENSHVTQPHHIKHKFNDDEADHELIIEMFGKTSEHTKIGNNGEIIKDVMLSISNLKFDDISLENAISDIAEYHHDFNGTQAVSVNKFYGNLGCNGQVRIKFTTPIYLWLLETI